ncbi:MAG: hypothetical protein ACAI35_15080 [Candidatus Methylacidiphilales bacterium]|nr:hypothetical protein [Candidatus Methylacidiphilales bacterium]
MQKPSSDDHLRARTSSQIAGLEMALKHYRIDNGEYPVTVSGSMPSPVNQGDPATYADSARLLFSSLSGRANFGTAPVSGIKSYYPFKRNQISGLSSTVAADAWGNAIGYNSRKPHHNPGSFDLWSTGGGKLIAEKSRWIANFGLPDEN